MKPVLMSPIGEHKQMTRQGILLELLDDQTVEPVETAAQINWYCGRQHSRGARYIQHGSARNSWSNVCNSTPFCNRTIQPLGLTTAAVHLGTGAGKTTSLNFTGGSLAKRSRCNHLRSVERPTPCRLAKSFLVI
jgi:hypothetical protein